MSRRRWRIILKWTLKKQDVRMYNGFNWLMVGSVAGCCEYSNKPSGVMKNGKLLELLSEFQLLKKHPVPCN
jgi:hypothetical protein